MRSKVPYSLLRRCLRMPEVDERSPQLYNRPWSGSGRNVGEVGCREISVKQTAAAKTESSVEQEKIRKEQKKEQDEKCR
jgi:hypothetical protein